LSSQKVKQGYKLVKTLFGKYEEIPDDWEIKKLGQIISKTQLGTGRVGVVGGKGIPLLKMGNLTFGKFNFNKLEKIPLSEVESGESYLLEKNDFIFNTRNSEKLVGKCSVWKDDLPKAIFNNNLMRISFSHEVNNSEYISYFFNSPFGRLSLRRLVDRTTSVAAIYFGQLKILKLFLPKIQEQQRITSILSGIDNLIDSYDKAIEYSTKLKRGLMQQLFTKGIAQKKFKKVKWLFGKEIEIPEKWEIKRTVDIGKDFGDSPFGSLLKSKDYTKKGIPVLQGKNIKNNQFVWKNGIFVSKEKFDSLKRSHCNIGDLVFQKIGTIGVVAIIPKLDSHETYLLSTNMMKMSVKETIMDIKFTYYLFVADKMQKQIQSMARGNVQPIFNFTTLKKLLVVVPPISEQQKIASILNTIDSKITGLKSKKTYIESLKKELMQKLLIGQIRVKV
jgi:type I restriction enzyme, S subunit